jgi:hypothetical protein
MQGYFRFRNFPEVSADYSRKLKSAKPSKKGLRLAIIGVFQSEITKAQFNPAFLAEREN